MLDIQWQKAFERVETWLLAVDAATIAVFLATIDSLSAPCGVGSEYYGGHILQVVDVFCTYGRGALLVLSALSVAKIFGNGNLTKGFTALYCILATALACISLVCSLLDFGLNCPNSDHLMGCSSAKHWMVPRNYCAAQLAECNVLEDQKKEMQMCVRMGRAPLVNGAFSTWLIRTAMLDVIRVMLLLVVLTLAYASDATPSGEEQRDAVASGIGSEPAADVLRPASTRLHERDTLLLPEMPDDGVIRQSPHVRKRTNAPNFTINF